MYKKRFIFGGYVNSIIDPDYLAKHFLDGDVTDILGLLYDDTSIAELMTDPHIPVASFGSHITSEAIEDRILLNEDSD